MGFEPAYDLSLQQVADSTVAGDATDATKDVAHCPKLPDAYQTHRGVEISGLHPDWLEQKGDVR